MSDSKSEEKVLDGPTLEKLKHHNRSIYQQKKQDALALRQKLEQWKEERRKKKVEEQKSKTVPFVTTVLKPKQTKVPGLDDNVKLPACSKPVGASVKLEGNTTKPSVSRKSLSVPVKQEGSNTKPSVRRKSVSVPVKQEGSKTRLSASGKSVAVPIKTKRPVAPTQGKQTAVPVKKEPLLLRRSHQPVAQKHQQIAEKENKKVARKSAPLERNSTGLNPTSVVFRSSALGASRQQRKTGQTNLTKTRRVTFSKSQSGTKQETAGQKTPVRDRKGLAGSSGHVSFVITSGKADGEGARFRKTPGKSKAQDFMRSFDRLKLNEWLEAKGRTPSGLRHTGCFGCEASTRCDQTPRSHMQASMSVEQLSRQKSALTKEDTVSLQTASAQKANSTFIQTTHPSPPTPANNEHDTNVPSTPNSEQVMFCQGTEDRENGDLEAEGAGGMTYGGVEDAMEVDGTVSPQLRAEDGAATTTGADQLNTDLQKCLSSIEAGSLRSETALEWLDLVGQAWDDVRCHAGWYKCRVAALKATGDQDAVLAVFEEAIIHNAQPADELAHFLTDTMKELLEKGQGRGKRKRKSSVSFASASSAKTRRCCHRAGHQPDVQAENMFESTKVKYSVVEVTPFKKRRRLTGADDKIIPVVTPVRRSARFGSSHAAPASDGRPPHGTPYLAEYSTLEELPSEEKEQMLFQPNQALGPLLSDDSPTVRCGDSPIIRNDNSPMVGSDGSPIVRRLSMEHVEDDQD